MNLSYQQAASEFREADRQWKAAVRAVQWNDCADAKERRRLVAETVRLGLKAHHANMKRIRALERITLQ